MNQIPSLLKRQSKLYNLILFLGLCSIEYGSLQAQNFDIYLSDAGTFSSGFQIIKYDSPGANPTAVKKNKIEAPNATEKEILALINKMERLFQKQKYSEIANIYTKDARMIGNHHEILGYKAIADYWAKLKDRGISWELINLEIIVDQEFAIQRGISKMKLLYKEKEHLSEVRFTLVWKKVNDQWKILIDHYSLL